MFVTIASRKGTASPSSAKSPEGKLGQWPWLKSDSVKRHYKHVYVKKLVTYSVSGSQETLKPQINHYSYLCMGSASSVTPDDLWKVNMQCQRSDVVICWPKPFIISPLQSMAASSVAEKSGFLERSVRGCSSYDVIAPWSDSVNFSPPKVAQRIRHKLCKISAISSQRFGGHFRKTHGWGVAPTPLHWRGLACKKKITNFDKYIFWENRDLLEL